MSEVDPADAATAAVLNAARTQCYCPWVSARHSEPHPHSPHLDCPDRPALQAAPPRVQRASEATYELITLALRRAASERSDGHAHYDAELELIDDQITEQVITAAIALLVHKPSEIKDAQLAQLTLIARGVNSERLGPAGRGTSVAHANRPRPWEQDARSAAVGSPDPTYQLEGRRAVDFLDEPPTE